jgi:hypothetical protein
MGKQIFSLGIFVGEGKIGKLCFSWISFPLVVTMAQQPYCMYIFFFLTQQTPATTTTTTTKCNLELIFHFIANEKCWQFFYIYFVFFFFVCSYIRIFVYLCLPARNVDGEKAGRMYSKILHIDSQE